VREEERERERRERAISATMRERTIIATIPNKPLEFHTIGRAGGGL
jgi:hypothetical protein